jgi:hypothetical protein
MPRRNRSRNNGLPNSGGMTPGQLYRNITSLGNTFDEEETEGQIRIQKQNWFVEYCKKMARASPSLTRNASWSKEHEAAVNFLGWKLSAGEFTAGVKGTFMQYIFPIIFAIVILFAFGIGVEIGNIDTADFIGGGFLVNAMPSYTLAFNLFLVLSFLMLGGLGAWIYYLYSYPIGEANAEKTRSLTYVPEMVGYMIMSMKLVPNLEKAIEFSAKHGQGKISVEFKRLIWDFQIGVHNSVSEGLDKLAIAWGEYSSELKDALMKIRASVMEPSESHRYALLDKTMLEVLDGVKEKMEDYARSLNQPAVMLFYLGVLLPLILIIVLPVGSAFSQNPIATTPVLFVVYCILIPMAAYGFAKNVIDKRPPTYEPPEITDSFRELPPRWRMDNGLDARMVAVFILIVGMLLTIFISTQGLPPRILFGDDEEFADYQFLRPDLSLGELSQLAGRDADHFAGRVRPFGLNIDLYIVEFYDVREGSWYQSLVDQGVSEEQAYQQAARDFLVFTSNPSNDPTKYIFWSGLIITIVVVISFLLFHRNNPKREAQLKIMKMEDEFKESMYVIASRMGENKPVESALKQTRDFLPNLIISKRIFSKTVENIELIGLPLEGAVFDPVYGSMKGIPSKTLNTAMRLLVDSVTLGVEVASRTLMSLSLQMENMDKVNKSLKVMVSDVTTTMTTMAVFIGPIVLGITVALQRVVMMTLAGVVANPSVEETTAFGAGAGGIGGLAGGGASGLTGGGLFQLSVDGFLQLASPLAFLFIISIYVIEIVIIMIYFTTKVQEDNELLFRINLAKYLPIATTIFVVVALFSSLAVSSMLGG